MLFRNKIILEEIQNYSHPDGRVYTTPFRHVVCQAAMRNNDATRAANDFKVGRSTVWRWMKTYGYATNFWADRYQKAPHITQFNERVSSRYDDETRVAAALYGVRAGQSEAADYYGVSRGSVYNWIKSFGLARAHLN